MTKKVTKTIEKKIESYKSSILSHMEEYEEKYKPYCFDLDYEEGELYEAKINHFYWILEWIRQLMSIAPREGFELHAYVYRNIDDQIFHKYYEEMPYSQREYLEAETAIPALIELIKQGGFDEFFLDDCITYSLKDFTEQRDVIASSMWEIVNGDYPLSTKKLAEDLLFEISEVEDRKYYKKWKEARDEKRRRTKY